MGCIYSHHRLFQGESMRFKNNNQRKAVMMRLRYEGYIPFRSQKQKNNFISANHKRIKEISKEVKSEKYYISKAPGKAQIKTLQHENKIAKKYGMKDNSKPLFARYER